MVESATMNEQEVERMRLALENVRSAKVAAAESEYGEGMAALDRVWGLFRSISGNDDTSRVSVDVDAIPAVVPTATPTAPPANPPSLHVPDGDLASATNLVRMAVKRMQGQFGNTAIREFIQQQLGHEITTKEVASVLYKMHKRGEISIVREGKPNQPAVYVANRSDGME